MQLSESAQNSTQGSNTDRRYDATLLTCTLRSHKPHITRVRAGKVGGSHYQKWRRSLLIRAETSDFHSRCEIGEEGSLGDDAHL